ncbi:UNVERIFIED_CONTAM: hypothetical protein Slati_3916400 [Sesamum latifolium]|uniref:Uncharacterized protein n=1 Tax=Sesamum latifolium TaxID=2727402 RepID=A0AAW2TMF0_9LAMI
MGIVLQAGQRGSIRRGLGPDTCPWGPEWPYCGSGKADERCRVSTIHGAVASAPDRLEAHLSAVLSISVILLHKRVMNPIVRLTVLCTRLTLLLRTVISREGRHQGSNDVAMNAWLPQPSLSCGNFYDTSSFSNFEDVPPKPKTPTDNVLPPDRPAEASLGSKKRGSCPRLDSRNK